MLTRLSALLRARLEANMLFYIPFVEKNQASLSNFDLPPRCVCVHPHVLCVHVCKSLYQWV